tara:strand:- start:1541 stop:1789 length:249 start_codon:yes stop_codon:yes gene_type:complete
LPNDVNVPKGFDAWNVEILQKAVFEPGKWTSRTLSEHYQVPWPTMKNRVGHLRAVGYIKRKVHAIIATDDGRVAYHKRMNMI